MTSAGWPMFEASAEKRADWLAQLHTLKVQFEQDILRFPWHQGFRIAHAQLCAVIATYQPHA